MFTVGLVRVRNVNVDVPLISSQSSECATMSFSLFLFSCSCESSRSVDPTVGPPSSGRCGDWRIARAGHLFSPIADSLGPWHRGREECGRETG